MNRTNILLIMSDNHSADLLSCYGNPEIHTPHLDQLADQGARFNQAHCVNAMFSPCRASVLTGLMPSQHGIHTWIDDRRMEAWPPNWNALAEFDTLPEILQRNGYATAMIGKYHLGNPEQPQNGFDHWVTFPHGHTRSFYENQIIDNDERSTYPGHIVDFFTEKAVDYIEDQDGDQPFFLFLPYNAPYGHWPSIKGQAQNRFADLYAETPMHSIPREGICKEMIERVLLTMHDSGQGLDYTATMQIPNDLASLRNYFSQMSMVDDGVGQVLAALEKQGLAEDTLIIYTADHGFSNGQHGFWGHGQATWPSNTHRAAFNIPLLISHKNQIDEGQVLDGLVSQTDLFATILDYTGIDNPTPEVESYSLRSSLQADIQESGREAIFMEQEETRSIRTAEWLYMERFKECERYPLADALFATDDEYTNLIDDPNHAQVRQQLSEQLNEFFANYSDPQFDLWQGGTVKSNTSRPWLWADVWGDGWSPRY